MAHISDAGAWQHITQHVGSHMLTVADVSDAAGTAAQQVAEEVVKSPSVGGGPFDFLAIGFERALTVLDGGLEKVGVPYSYGFAIILLTLLVKIATYPLTKKQVESTVAMQAIQPRVKDLQAKYPNDPERLQMETAKMYKDAGVNPLAGCLPTLATIPVFIGLYRALTLAAQDGLLHDGFFWIPSLGGPASIQQQLDGQGMSWLFPFVDGQPPLGWQMTIAYLIMPILLVVSQSVSQKIISPPSDDPAQQQTQQILKFIPFLIGWFSLNVPSGLTLYWFTNNILTTAQQVYLKGNAKVSVPTPVGTIVNPEVMSPTIDVKSTGAETGARRSKGEKFRARKAAAAQEGGSADPRGKKRKGDKFKARRQKEQSTASGQKSEGVVVAEQVLEPEQATSAKANNGTSSSA